LPPNREDIVVVRIVVRNGFSFDLADLFLADLERVVEWFERLSAPMPQEDTGASGFHHQGEAWALRRRQGGAWQPGWRIPRPARWHRVGRS
jgi:hypothetical protein